jgi:O-antigen ligase
VSLLRRRRPEYTALPFRFADYGSCALFYLVVALAPLPLGSTEPAIVAIWCVVLGGTVTLASLLEIRTPQLVFIGLAAVLVVMYGVVLHEQISLHPWFASPHPIWKETAETLQIPIEPSVSIARNQPWFAIGAPLAALLSFLSGLLVGTNRSRAHQLLNVIAWSGVAYAIYGIAFDLIDPATGTFRVRPIPLTSTFVNRNTAAVYFGACSVIWLLLICERMRQQVLNRYGSKDSIRVNGPRLLLGQLILLLTMMVCLLATFLSGSRAGVSVSLISFVVAVVAFFYRDLAGRRVLFAVAAGGVVALLTLYVLAGNVVARFYQDGLMDHTRLSLYRATLRMIADHPWFGTGLGTFNWAFPAYRSDDVSMYGIYDLAHNTLLELAAEAGLPLACVVVIAWIVAFGVLAHGVRTRRRDRIIPAAALSVGLLAVFHTLVDFSLQIPGFAIVIFGLLGVGVAQSFSSPQKSLVISKGYEKKLSNPID